MPQTEAAIKGFALAHRKDACCRGDPPVTHNHASIMQSGFRMKNSEQQLDGEISFELDTSLFINANGSVAFDRNQGAELFAGKLRDRLRKFVKHLAFFAADRKNGMPAEFRQSS